MNYPVITTSLVGTLLKTNAEPYSNAEVIIEMTDADNSFIGMRSSAYCDEKGKYSFKIMGGYYNLYILENPDAVETKIGKVHVSPSDYDRVYTIEELLNK